MIVLSILGLSKHDVKLLPGLLIGSTSMKN
jgi:hypothetical protein